MSAGYLFLSTLMTLIVILDPPGLLPVFVGLTRNLAAEQRNQAALRASLVAFGVIAAFAIFGREILDYLHVSVAALQVAGGLLLLLVALQLLTGQESEPAAQGGVNIAIVPLGTPLLAGPGAIVATMIAVESANTWVGYLTVAAALVTAMLVVWLSLRFAMTIRRLLGEAGTILASRIAGLLLSAIAVQMVAEGVRGFITTIP